MLVDKSNKGFPLNPPVSRANGSLSAGGGQETVIFDIICLVNIDKIMSRISTVFMRQAQIGMKVTQDYASQCYGEISCGRIVNLPGHPT